MYVALTRVLYDLSPHQVLSTTVLHPLPLEHKRNLICVCLPCRSCFFNLLLHTNVLLLASLFILYFWLQKASLSSCHSAVFHCLNTVHRNNFTFALSKVFIKTHEPDICVLLIFNVKLKKWVENVCLTVCNIYAKWGNEC